LEFTAAGNCRDRSTPWTPILHLWASVEACDHRLILPRRPSGSGDWGCSGGRLIPPHAGHAHITAEALKRFGLDGVLVAWSVRAILFEGAPGACPLARAEEAARALMTDPARDDPHIEARIGDAVITAQTNQGGMQQLLSAPRVSLLGCMGADNSGAVSRWRTAAVIEAVPFWGCCRPGGRIPARPRRQPSSFTDPSGCASA